VIVQHMKLKRLKYAPIVLLAFVAAVAAAHWLTTGPRDLKQFPPPDASPYRLPFPAGKTFWCVQGNRDWVSHRGWGEFAYDFAMPVGSDVCAARAGEVVRVVVEHDGHGYKWPNNLIAVRHEDGTLGYYLHIRKGGNRVSVGDVVAQGQPIAASGHVGNSSMPHLHFHVTDPERKRTLPVSFADVRRDSGIPRTLKRYASGSVLPGALEAAKVAP